MAEEKGLVVRPLGEMASFEEVQHQVKELDKFYKSLMQKGTDYDTIPGTSKPTLLKPGAELLRLRFGVRVEPIVEAAVEDWERGVFAYRITARGYDANGNLLGAGVGSCSSLEAKYRFRWVSDNELPKGIDKEQLVKKWVKRKDGKSFPLFRIENDNAQDQANTILKMAKKRAFVDLMLTLTGASRIFTQDLEDMEAEVLVEDKEIEESTIAASDSAPLDMQDWLKTCPEHNVAWFPGKYGLSHKHGDTYCNASKVFGKVFIMECNRYGWTSENNKDDMNDFLKRNFDGKTWSKLDAGAMLRAIAMMRIKADAKEAGEETALAKNAGTPGD